MKLLRIMVGVFTALILTSVMAAENAYNIQIHNTLLPIYANARWTSESAATASRLHATRGVTNPIGNVLLTSYITQPGDRNGNSLWTVARITAKPGGPKLRINMLDSSQTSSDTGNSLGSVYSLVGGSYVFSPQVIGVIWGPGGENGDRVGEQVIASGPDRDVDEINIVFLQSPYYPYADQTAYSGIERWVTASNLAIDIRIRVIGAGNVVLATATKRLQSGATPLTAPSLSIANDTGGMVAITVTADPRSTVNLWVTEDFVTWNLDSTVNNGDVVKRPASTTFKSIRAATP